MEILHFFKQVKKKKRQQFLGPVESDDILAKNRVAV